MAELQDTIIQTKASRRTKYAIFDFDGTIVKPKDGRRFPKDVDDWQYLRPSVPEVLQKYGKTHHVVIVTDQSKPWKITQIQNVMKLLNLEHLTVVIGVKTQKPKPDLFNKALPKFKPDHAFYVGDAAGRPGDWSDKDKLFATNINVKFFTPEEIFYLAKDTKAAEAIKPNPKKEVIIMVGYPASGKSTIAKTTFTNYHIVNGDLLKTPAAMIKDAEKHVETKSIVFDSTAGTKEKRSLYIKFAEKHDLPVRVLWVTTPIDVAMERNKTRALSGGPKIPDIAFYVYRKHFQKPEESEGFKLLTV